MKLEGKKMMRMKTKLTGLSPLSGGVGQRSANDDGVVPAPNNTTVGGGGGDLGVGHEWELRPGGMLVQKRLDSDQDSAPPRLIRVRVKYGSTYHELTINPQASFGELKKKLSGPTGLHHEDQKIFFKKKEKDSRAYLDMAGVKDKSKLVLVEDAISQEKRLLEMRKNANMDKAAKSISQISLQVDKLAAQVSDLESVISKGGKVSEKDVLNLIELLMNELIKIDGIVADGDAKLQRKMQVKRVQKYVETLDMLKVKNSINSGNNNNGAEIPAQQQQNHNNQQQPSRLQSNGVNRPPPHPKSRPPTHPQSRRTVGHSPLRPQQPDHQNNSGASTVVTTQWEMFDAMPPLIPVESSSSSLPPTSRAVAATGVDHHHPKFDWESFE